MYDPENNVLIGSTRYSFGPICRKRFTNREMIGMSVGQLTAHQPSSDHIIIARWCYVLTASHRENVKKTDFVIVVMISVLGLFQDCVVCLDAIQALRSGYF